MSLSIRSLVSDTAVYGLTTILGRFLTFLLTPFYTHYLSGPTEYGHIATIYTGIAFINIVYSFGLDTAFMRFYTDRNSNEKKTVFNNAFWGIFFLSFLFTIIGLGVLFWSDVELKGLSNSTYVLLCAALIPFLDALMVAPYALLRMERRSKRFALTKFAIIVINVLCNIYFVGTIHMGALGVMLSGVISSFSGILILLPEYIRSVRVSINKELLKEMFLFGLPTVPAAFSSIVLQLVDRPILGMLTDTRTVGLYQASYRLGIPMMIFVSIFETAWKPFYLSNNNKPEAKETFSKVLTLFTAVCAVIFVSVSLFITDIVALPIRGKTLINSIYWSGLHIIPIILAGYWFNGIYINIAAGFHISKQTKYLPIAMGCAAISNVLLNFILMPYWGITGAALSMLVSYIIASSILLAYSRSIYPIRYEWSTIFLIVLTCATIYLLYMMLHPNLWQKGIITLIAFAVIASIVQKRSNLLRSIFKR